MSKTVDKVETAPETPVDTKPALVAENGPKFSIVKGDVTAIPAELLSRTRNEYDWGLLEVGDHFATSDESQFNKIRSSATAYGRGTKKRAARNFSTRTVEEKDSTGKVIKKTLEVWRLADSPDANKNVKQEPTVPTFA